MRRGHLFSDITMRGYKSYPQNLSHDVKASLRIGNTYPILRMDVLPGDKFNTKSTHLLKFQPMLAPIMHTLDVKVDYFYVPYRLLHKGFNDFVFGVDPENIPPYFTLEHVYQYLVEKYRYNEMLEAWTNEPGSLPSYLNQDFQNLGRALLLLMPGSLYDFLGYPTLQYYDENLGTFPKLILSTTYYIDVARPEPTDTPITNLPLFMAELQKMAKDVPLTALPLLAVRKIYNDYFRWYATPEFDLDIDHIQFGVDITERMFDSEMLYHLQNNWQRDYFTSALDSPQAGDPVPLSIGGTAPLVMEYAPDGVPNNDYSTKARYSLQHPDAAGDKWIQGRLAVHKNDDENYTTIGLNYSRESLVTPEDNSNPSRVQIDVTNHTKADLSNATSLNVESFRFSLILQRIREKMNVGGRRPIELLKSLFGVNSSDARLQLSEYLGGGRQGVVTQDVIQTTEEVDSPYYLGRQAGNSYSVGQSFAFNKFFEEHGIILGFIRISPRSSYYQGVHRDLLRTAYDDFALPDFSILGEQSVFNAELYWKSLDPLGTFGYQERYADYKYIPDKIHGDFKTTLSYWHMGRFFKTEPRLNDEFQKQDSEAIQNSVFPYPDQDVIYMDMYHDVKAYRRLKPNYK